MAKAKRVKGINCDAAAADGIKQVLVARFKEMSALRDAALDWADPEGVHSMRVASRRLRSVLRDCAPYLRKRNLTSLQKEIRSLADALGEVRDQDVAIMALEKLATHTPAKGLPALKEHVDARKEIRELARTELTSALETGAFEELESSFIDHVDKATATHDPDLSFRSMAQAIILDRLKELEKLSDSLFSPFDIENLHEMRIAAKRLRYALELFEQCWRNGLTTYAKRVARIQSALGDVHDCDVWIESFGKEIGAARKHKRDEQVAALVWLLGHFVKLRTKHLRQALNHWCEWESRDVSAKLRASLNSKPERPRVRRI